MSYNLSVSSPQLLHNAVTAVSAGGIFYVAGLCERVTVVCRGTTTAGVIASGNLVIEEAFYFKAGTGGTEQRNEPPWAGPWSVIQTINAVDLTLGATQVVHIMGSVWALRVRVSVVVAGGGTVDVWAWAN